MLSSLSTGHKIGLAATGAAFILFALASALVVPRVSPGFPGRRLPLYMAVCVAFFAAMLSAVLVFGREAKQTHSAAVATGATPATPNVAYSQIQAVFDRNGCTSCHPALNPSLDLRAGKSYAELVGVRAVDDPTLYRVVAGDPGKSFLYLKLGGDPAFADIPAIGNRMPLGGDPISSNDLRLVRDWILDGAKGTNGKTGGPAVVTPGSPPAGLQGTSLATSPTGTGTIRGRVFDQEHRPLAGALVSLLLQGPQLQGGEDHYRFAQADAAGRFVLLHAPSGRFLLKAYAPNTIYVSRIVALKPGGNATIEFGLPGRVVANPVISAPTIAGEKISLTVRGTNLDGNYTLALNRPTGRIVELHNAGDAPGRWSGVMPRRLAGPWLFLAVDSLCNISNFITVAH